MGSIIIWCGHCRDVVPYHTRISHQGVPYPTCKRCGSPLLALAETVVAPCSICHDENVEPPAEGMLVRGTRWSDQDRKIIPVRIWVCEQHTQEFEQVTRYEFPSSWDRIVAWREMHARMRNQ